MTFRGVIAVCALVMAGCAVERTTPPPDTATVAVTPEPVHPPAPSPPTPDGTAAVPDAASAPTSAVPSPVTSAPSAIPALEGPAGRPDPDGPADLAALPDPAGESEVVTAPLPPARVAPPPPADTLDFSSLGARLRTTKAIGVLAKLSVKNQADDLLAQFRDYHNRQGAATLPDLRRSYDLLVLELLSLVREGDPPLAMDIDRSRAAIWKILSDPSEFIDANLMAGASR